MLARALAPRDEHSFRFVEAGEVIKVTVRTERMKYVAVSKSKPRRGQHEKTVTQTIQDALPALPIELR